MVNLVESHSHIIWPLRLHSHFASWLPYRGSSSFARDIVERNYRSLFVFARGARKRMFLAS